MKRRKPRRTHRPFAELEEALRPRSGERAWRRAVFLSRLRHSALACGRRRSARRLGEAKVRALLRAISLVPNHIHVSIDGTRHLGLGTVAWKSEPALHVPARHLGAFLTLAAARPCPPRRPDATRSRRETAVPHPAPGGENGAGA